jgi:uncharacterized RDD family membrane protein YckC
MQTIEIKTSQNVTIEYELATLWERCLALLLDIVIIVVSYLIFTLLISAAFNSQNSEQSSILMRVLNGLVPIIVFLIYQFAMEVFADGQTLGKKALKIKALRLNMDGSGVSDYMLRSIFYLVDFLFSGGILAALLISTTQKRQRLGDMTANTAVVKLQSSYPLKLNDILKISTLDDYQPVYPEVRNLSEKDMLLIKGTIVRFSKLKNSAHGKAINELILHLQEVLDIPEVPRDRIGFLKTLIKDYIVLTR